MSREKRIHDLKGVLSDGPLALNPAEARHLADFLLRHPMARGVFLEEAAACRAGELPGEVIDHPSQRPNREDPEDVRRFLRGRLYPELEGVRYRVLLGALVEDVVVSEGRYDDQKAAVRELRVALGSLRRALRVSPPGGRPGLTMEEFYEGQNHPGKGGDDG